MKAWPFPGDSPVARARKVALAYRQLAREQHDRAVDLIDALRDITADQWAQLVGDEEANELHKSLHKDLTDPVVELDRRFRQWGEAWHAEIEGGLDPDDYVTPEQAGALIQITGRTMLALRARGRIEGVFVPQSEGSRRGQWRFKVADVYKLSAQRRPRGWNLHKTTDTVHDNGGGDAE